MGGRSYNGYDVSAQYFGSYCMDGLAMALWSLNRSSSFVESIVTVANLLGDADTTSAIVGQIAGAFYGYRSIAAAAVEKDDDEEQPQRTNHRRRSSSSSGSGSGCCSESKQPTM